jgi:hypothetical protein
LHKIIGKGLPYASSTHEVLGHVRERATMWEIPWWIALIIAWAAGSAGFLLGLVLATGTRADRELEEQYEIDMKKGRTPADVRLGYDFDRWQLPDTRWTKMASATREHDVPR